MDTTIAPYGTWRSPLSAAAASTSDMPLRNLQADGDAIVWLELRPTQNGRGVVVRWTAEHGVHDVTPAHSDVGSRVHEYGGGEYRSVGGAIVYSEKSDGSVWLIEDRGEPKALVTVAGCRYADFEFDVRRRRVYAVREDHRDRPAVDPFNRLVALDLDAPDPARNAGTPIDDRADFVASPRLSPDGERLAWIAWDHPNMPWDGTRLLVATADAFDRPRVAAGSEPESIEQIAWSPDGVLYFTSDRTGWTNVYTDDGAGGTPACPASLDFGRPAWTFRAVGIAPLSARRALCAYVDNGTRNGALIDGGAPIAIPIGQIQDAPQPSGAGLAYIAESPGAPAAVQRASDFLGNAVTVLRSAGAPLLDADDVAVGRPMTFPVPGGDVTHAFYYAPQNRRFAGPDGARPPLIVTSHGGPTSMRTNAFALGIQFWTTRGFAVADVNYRGSTGFGRAYRNKLRGAWGIADVEDCVAVARGLIDAGAVDARHIAIRGGSSSGFTTLAALTMSDVFRAGAAYYPVTDLGVFSGETHKFESRYVDGLVGPATATELYRARSPLTNVRNIAVPVAIFQGLDDKVVPPNQSELMVNALRAQGTPVEYHAYAGEGHGFLKAATLRDALESELAFYGRAPRRIRARARSPTVRAAGPGSPAAALVRLRRRRAGPRHARLRRPAATRPSRRPAPR
jgi:dipeptidyl aminopeptidase/acylaminoacyl peptidase